MRKRSRIPKAGCTERALAAQREPVRPRVQLAGEFVQEVDLDLLQLDHAVPLVVQQVVELLVQAGDLELGLEVHAEVLVGLAAVARGVAVLRHHDDRRLQRGHAGEQQVEQDEGVGIEGLLAQGPDVDRDPDQQKTHEGAHEEPRPADHRHAVGQALRGRAAGLELVVDVGRERLVRHGLARDVRLDLRELAAIALQGREQELDAHAVEAGAADRGRGPGGLRVLAREVGREPRSHVARAHERERGCLAAHGAELRLPGGSGCVLFVAHGR
jgi:hypothetical protein